MIEGEISHDINEPVSEKIKNNFKLPFDLIEETLLANDRYAFEYILSYIEKLKISFTQNFRPVLENEIDTGFRVMMECGTSDYHFVFSYLKPIYFECIRIDFVSDEYKERLQKIWPHRHLPYVIFLFIIIMRPADLRSWIFCLRDPAKRSLRNANPRTTVLQA